MENINFKELKIDELELQGMDVLELYYDKYKEIYGTKFSDVFANSKEYEDKIEFLHSDCPNYQNAYKTVCELSNGIYKMIAILSNNIILGAARVIVKNDNVLVPDMIFRKEIDNSEANYLSVLLARYIENLYNKQVFIETPHKNRELLVNMQDAGFEVDFNPMEERYNTDKTFLLTRKNR